MSQTTQELGITLRRIKTGYKYLQKKQSKDVLISLYYSCFYSCYIEYVKYCVTISNP